HGDAADADAAALIVVVAGHVVVDVAGDGDRVRGHRGDVLGRDGELGRVGADVVGAAAALGPGGHVELVALRRAGLVQVEVGAGGAAVARLDAEAAVRGGEVAVGRGRPLPLGRQAGDVGREVAGP